MKEILVIIMVIALIVVFVVVAILISRVQGKKRTEAVRQLALEMGLGFSAVDQLGLRTHLSHFNLFKLGGSPKIVNVMEAETEDVRVLLFDYGYTINSGQTPQTVDQSVISVESRQLETTPYSMRPGKLVDILAGIMGKKRISFDNHPEFSKLYHLKSNQEEQVRQMFDIELLDFFTRHKGVSVESVRGGFIYYQSGKRVNAANLKDFLQQGYQLFGLLSDPSRNVPTRTALDSKSFIS